MDQFRKFIPLSKIEEQSDGTLHVYGIVTAQQPDHDGEVCDYDTSAPLFRAQAARMLKITSAVNGMEPSLMPMREMHQLKAIGAGRSMDFDDAEKTIRMGFSVVEPDAITKFKKGVLIGFSQGGEYVKKWPDPDFKGKTRYTADPLEVSAVDSPCLPSALVESMKGRTFEMQKSNGSIELKAFDIPAESELRMERIERVLETMVKRDFNTEQRRHLAGTGAALPDGSFPIENAKDLENAIHDVGRAHDPAEAKRHIEARAKTLGLTNLLPKDWESNSKAATGGEENTMEKLTDIAGYQKAAKTLHDHLKGLKDAHDAVGEHIEKCMKAVGSMADGDAADKAAKTEDSELQKRFDDLNAKFDALSEKLSKTPETPAAATGILDEFKKSSGFAIDEDAEDSRGYVPPGMGGGEITEALNKSDLLAV